MVGSCVIDIQTESVLALNKKQISNSLSIFYLVRKHYQFESHLQIIRPLIFFFCIIVQLPFLNPDIYVAVICRNQGYICSDGIVRPKIWLLQSCPKNGPHDLCTIPSGNMYLLKLCSNITPTFDFQKSTLVTMISMFSLNSSSAKCLGY